MGASNMAMVTESLGEPPCKIVMDEVGAAEMELTEPVPVTVAEAEEKAAPFTLLDLIWDETSNLSPETVDEVGIEMIEDDKDTVEAEETMLLAIMDESRLS